FLGSMIGHWEVPEDANPVLTEAVNMGLSVVVPAPKILEIINHPELMEMRRAVHENRKQEKAKWTTLDSSFGKETQTTAQDFKIPTPTHDAFFHDLKKASRKIKPIAKKR